MHIMENIKSLVKRKSGSIICLVYSKIFLFKVATVEWRCALERCAYLLVIWTVLWPRRVPISSKLA